MTMQKTRHFVGKMILTALAMALLLVTAVAAASTETGTITASALRVREQPSTSSQILAMIPNGTIVELKGEKGDWFITSYNGATGYISKEYVKVNEPGDGKAVPDSVSTSAAAVAASTQEIKQDVVDTACSYMGTRYVYGGASPSGFDCSGFSMYVYQLFGYSLPHSATGQMSYGTSIDSKDALHMGDLVFFLDYRYASSGASHVGIYIGNGKFVHAPNSRNPVMIDTLMEGYWSDTYIGATRLIQG